MEKIKPRTLSGFMELLPEAQSQMDAVMDVLRSTYALFGFTNIDTPVLEASEILLAKGGGETEKQIYRFEKGDTDLAMRFDLTVPLAKYVAMNYGSLTFPFRRCQIGKVYRGERAQRGRFREFYQADVDVIGDGSLDPSNEAEMVAVICETFRRLGLGRFVIRMNNRRFLNGLFEYLGLKEQSAAVLGAIDKLDKIGRDKVQEILTDTLGIPADKASELMDIVSAADPEAMLERLTGKCEALDRGIAELKQVTGLLPAFGVPEDKWRLDLTIARGLDYYTGTVYETAMLDHPEIGSICSGGRYDNLAEYYTDKPLPGVGISIGVTRLFYVLEEQGYLNEGVITAPADVLVLSMTDDMAPAIAAATALRDAGIRTQIYTEQKKFKAKMSYCSKLGIPFAVLLGEDEIAQGKLSLKNFETGEQVTVPTEEAIQLVRAALAEKDRGTVITER